MKPHRGQYRRAELHHLGGLWLGKTLAAAVRLAGRGGTTLPGRAAALAAPGLLPALAAQARRGSLVVTGTNGKTTTAALLANIFRQAGAGVVHNRSGSNLAWGVTSALVEACSWSGRLRGELAIMESDEGAFPAVAGALRPRAVIVTNIFRDQLDRYGEVDHVRALIRRGLAELPAGCVVLLNADDPSAAWLEREEEPEPGAARAELPRKEMRREQRPGQRAAQKAAQARRSGPNRGPAWRPLYYGLDLPQPRGDCENSGRDLKSCPLCREKLTYSVTYFAHLGRYRCPSCSFRRPEPAFRVTGRIVRPGGGAVLTLAVPGGRLVFDFPLPGFYNIYNALAAAACAHAWGLPAENIAAGLAQAVPSFGRMEQFEIEGSKVLMGLVKNPAGANEVLRTFLEIPGKFSLLAAINDNYADGTDISWLWDVDFEQLAAARERLAQVVVSGIRAADMAVRLKYAGLEPSAITVEPELRRALPRALEGTAGKPLVILPTYTAMLELRRLINRLGAARPFWEE